MLAVTVFEVLVAVVVMLLFCFRRVWRHSVMGDKIPGPRAYPIVGNALRMGSTTDLYVYMRELHKKFNGTAIRVWAGNKLTLFIYRPEDLEVFLGSNPHQLLAGFYKYFNAWMGDSWLFSAGTHQWKETRKFLCAMFTKNQMEDYVSNFHSNGEVIVDILKNEVGGPAFDMKHYTSLNALDNLNETLLGIDIKAQRDSDSRYLNAIKVELKIMMSRMLKPWLDPDVIFNLTSYKRKEMEAVSVLHEALDEAIRSRREVLTREMIAQKGTPGFSDVVETAGGLKMRSNYTDALIRSALEGSTNMTDKRIRGEVAAVGLAGHGTVSISVAYTLWSLAWHPLIQDKVVKELDELWPDSNEQLTYNKVHEFTYMEMVIKESLRLNPSIAFIGKHLLSDVPLKGGFVAPKGIDIGLALFLTHMDPEFYPDPEKFDPDRFLPENVESRPPYSYAPFSLGPRHCPGTKFAMVQMKCTIAHVLRNYKLLPGSASPKLTFCLEMVTAFKEGLQVKIVLRNPK